MSKTIVTAATMRKFRVLWYEAQEARAIITRPGDVPRPLQPKRPPPKRRKTFEIEARTMDGARRKAREAVARFGVRVLSVNFSQRPDELIVYSKERI